MNGVIAAQSGRMLYVAEMTKTEAHRIWKSKLEEYFQFARDRLGYTGSIDALDDLLNVADTDIKHVLNRHLGNTVPIKMACLERFFPDPNSAVRKSIKLEILHSV